MSLVITGASGQLGRRAAELLLDNDAVAPSDVVLVTRSPDTLADLAARGAQVRAGDFSRPETLGDAFAGATRVLIVSTNSFGDERVAQQRAAVQAAQTAGAELIAYTSLPNPDPERNPAGVAPDHFATEQAIIDSGVPYAFLRNALYADFKIPEAQGALAAGAYSFNTGDGVASYVSREDCAAAAAVVLAGGSEHAGQVYTITGDQLLSGADLADLFGSLGGAAVQARPVDDDTLVAQLRDQGLPAEMATLMASFGRAIRVGALDELTDDVQRLTGRAPQGLAEVLSAAGVGAS